MGPKATIAATVAPLLLLLGGGPSEADPGPRVIAYQGATISTFDEDGKPLGAWAPEALPRLPAAVVASGADGTVAIEDAKGDWIYLLPTEVRLSGAGGMQCSMGPEGVPMCSAPNDRGLPYCPGDPRCKRKKPQGG